MEQYGESLTQAFDRLTMAGRIALRRDQVVAAKKNPTMSRYLEARLARQEKPAEKGQGLQPDESIPGPAGKSAALSGPPGASTKICIETRSRSTWTFWVRRQGCGTTSQSAA